MKNLKKIISVTAAAAMVMSTVAPVSVFADDATFKIGGIGPVTGAAAIYGQAVKNATELAINEVNEDGGINGYQVEFKFEDDENDAEKTLNAYNALKDWGMNILVGTVTSTPCVAVANETAADNMFQLTPSGSATECVANPNVFRVCFSDLEFFQTLEKNASEGKTIIENEKEQDLISTQSMTSAMENECTEGVSFSMIIDLLSNFSDTIQNLWWLVTLGVLILVLMTSLFLIRKKANKYTDEQIKKLIHDGKYIPGIFVELNNSKEVLRYFVYGKKWRKRLIKNFNYVYDNSYGEILKKACDNQNVCFHQLAHLTL